MTDEFWRNLPASIAAVGAIVAATFSYLHGRTLKQVDKKVESVDAKVEGVRAEVNGTVKSMIQAEKSVSFVEGAVAEKTRAEEKAANIAEGVAVGTAAAVAEAEKQKTKG